MKLKVLNADDTPKNCACRVLLEHERGTQEWVRDQWDHTFLLWSNSRGHRGDCIYDRTLKKRVEVESPFEEILDEEGYGTGEHKEKEGLIVIPVDVYEHSGMVWFLRGEAPIGCRCQFDSTCYRKEAPFYLYVDKKRWEEYCGNCPWTFVDGKPTDELLKAAYKVARSEIHEMNLCETDSYYCYALQEKIEEVSDVEMHNAFEGTVRTDHRESYSFEDVDSCGGFLTDNPAREVDFPLGVPVVTTDPYLAGDTFDQECFALSDDMTGKFVKFVKDGCKLVDDPLYASLYCKSYLECNRKAFENDLRKALTVVDVTERVWSRFPECQVKIG